MLTIKKSFYLIIILSGTLFFNIIIYIQPSYAKSLTIGHVNSSPFEVITEFSPLVKLLEKNLLPYGIHQINNIVFNTILEVGNGFENNKLDLLIGSPIIAVAVHNISNNSEILLRQWYKNYQNNQFFILAEKYSDIKSIQYLKGKSIVFTKKYSDAGHLLAMLTLQNKKIILQKKSNLYATNNSKIINYLFSHNYVNTLIWLNNDKITAGTISVQDFNKIDTDSNENLQIIYESIKIPRSVVSLRKNMDQKLKKQIITILKSLHIEISNKTILENFNNTVKFDDITKEQLNTLLELSQSINNLIQYEKNWN